MLQAASVLRCAQLASTCGTKELRHAIGCGPAKWPACTRDSSSAWQGAVL